MHSMFIFCNSNSLSYKESTNRKNMRYFFKSKKDKLQELESLTDAIYREIVEAYSGMNRSDKNIDNLFHGNIRYERLSEHDKLFLLTGANYDTEELSLSEVYHARHIQSHQLQFQFKITSDSHMAPHKIKRPFWEYVISSDNVQCMDTLLQQTPLYAIHKANVPPEATWIKSAEWMQDVLHDQAARWDGQICDYNNIGKVSIIDNEASMMKVMTQIAFTMHAAELFSHCCKFAATKCTQYLLTKAPNLIHMKASCSSNRLALETALFHASPITDDLLAKGADVRREDSLNTLAEIYMKKRRPNIRLATELICQKNKDLIRKFKYDAYGDSLLHVLYRSLQKGEFPKVEETIYCTEQLLDAGVDPTEKASEKDTVLDLVLLLEVFSRHSRLVDSNEYLAGLHTLTACIQILLPMFKGLPAGKVHIPSSIMGVRNVSKETICLEVTAQVQHLLDNDVHLSSIGTMFGNLHGMFSYRFETQSPCSVCGPIVKLLYTILCTGCYGVNGSERIFLNNLAAINIRYFGTSCTFHYSHIENECQASDGQQCAPHGCCFWELLELTVHAGAEVCIPRRSVTLCSLEKVWNVILSYFNNHIKSGCPAMLQRIARFVRMSWIHFTCTENQTLLLKCLNKLLTDAQDSEYAEAVVTDLHKFIRNVLPLKTLTRQCIIKHVLWRDVKQLPLPSGLKVYVRLGDISADHPVHSMSNAQLTA